MRHNRFFLLALFCLSLSSAAITASAQNGVPSVDVMHLTTNLGSCKIFNGTGTISLTFKGTALVADVKGTIVPSGNVKEEYNAHGRRAFFGSGTLTVTGAWRSIQWFGSDLSATWKGRGGVTVYGEYDKNLKTGEIWYGNEAEKIPWSTGGRTLFLPVAQASAPKAPVLRGSGKSGG
jgi:hypothetical protein